MLPEISLKKEELENSGARKFGFGFTRISHTSHIKSNQIPSPVRASEALADGGGGHWRPAGWPAVEVRCQWRRAPGGGAVGAAGGGGRRRLGAALWVPALWQGLVEREPRFNPAQPIN